MPNGTISSPGYPEDYPNNAFCRTIIRAPKTNHVIQVNVTFIEMESYENCSFDSLTVFATEHLGMTFSLDKKNSKLHACWWINRMRSIVMLYILNIPGRSINSKLIQHGTITRLWFCRVYTDREGMRTAWGESCVRIRLWEYSTGVPFRLHDPLERLPGNFPTHP